MEIHKTEVDQGDSKSSVTIIRIKPDCERGNLAAFRNAVAIALTQRGWETDSDCKFFRLKIAGFPPHVRHEWNARWEEGAFRIDGCALTRTHPQAMSKAMREVEEVCKAAERVLPICALIAAEHEAAVIEVAEGVLNQANGLQRQISSNTGCIGAIESELTDHIQEMHRPWWQKAWEAWASIWNPPAPPRETDDLGDIA